MSESSVPAGKNLVSKHNTRLMLSQGKHTLKCLKASFTYKRAQLPQPQVEDILAQDCQSFRLQLYGDVLVEAADIVQEIKHT